MHRTYSLRSSKAPTASQLQSLHHHHPVPKISFLVLVGYLQPSERQLLVPLAQNCLVNCLNSSRWKRTL